MQGFAGTELYTSSVPDTTSMNNLNPGRMQPQLHRSPSRQFDVYGQAGNSSFDSYRGFPSAFSTLDGNTPNYELNGAQTWNHNTSAFNANGFGGLGPIGSSGATTRIRSARGRQGIPTGWLDNEPTASPNFASMDSSRAPSQGFGQRHGSAGSDLDDELIPTAIVIKNIPFAVRKEQLMNLMAEMHLPLPYAFNYHFDNGVFRGLAFANFTSPEETAAVIEALNMYELSGRKLRVEYKKMLPAEQRERIEREKRQRRGQLEEQHRPMVPHQLHNYPSMSSMSSHPGPSTSPNPQSRNGPMPRIDMNDPSSLKWYTDMVQFKTNDSQEIMIFDKGLEPQQRRTIHTLAHQLGLNHQSVGEGDKRQVHVYKTNGAHVSPPLGHPMGQDHGAGDTSRRGLSRAPTSEFNDNRMAEPSYNSTLRGQSSLNILPAHDMGGFGSNPNLRSARSVADLRYNTPSPVYSTASASFGGPNGLRLQQIDGDALQNGQPLLTPASSNPTLGTNRDEHMLSGGFSSLSLGTTIGNSGSPRRLRSMFSWDPTESQQQQMTAPIGSNRSAGGVESRTQPMRQPAIPTHDRGSGFRRPNGHQSRGSDEYRSPPGPEIIVE